MKGIQIRLFIAILMLSVVGACTDKKLENNIKSLERRVAALEKKSGITPTTESIQPVSSTQQPAGELAEMTFENTEYDFGIVNEGDVVDYTFKFTNTGKTPLLISKATASCGCTVPVWPKDPIPAGETGEIQVKFNTKNKPNQQTKFVSINANTKPEVTRLKISGNVVPSEDSNS